MFRRKKLLKTANFAKSHFYVSLFQHKHSKILKNRQKLRTIQKVVALKSEKVRVAKRQKCVKSESC
jgi:hypothetical protein